MVRHRQPDPFRGLSFPPEYEPRAGPGYWRAWRKLGTSGHPHVVLHGGYGKLNMGDDAILHVLLQHLCAGIPDVEISVICHGPRWVSRRYDVVAHHFSSLGALRAILSADLYIIGGGGIINRINTYSGRQTLRMLDPKGKFLFLAALLAAAAGAKVIFHAVGATSVPDRLVAWLAKQSMGCADEVSVRDALSRQVLQGLGVRGDIHLLPDPAISLEAAGPAVARRILESEGLDPDGRLVGLNLRPVIEPDVDNIETAQIVAEIADWLVDQFDAHICFLPFGRHPTKEAENDLVMAREVQARMAHVERFHILEHECTPPEMKAIIGQLDFCLLERLHAAILAAGAGTPFVAISYDAKVAQLMKAIGGQDRMVPLHGLNPEVIKALVASNVPWRSS